MSFPARVSRRILVALLLALSCGPTSGEAQEHRSRNQKPSPTHRDVAYGTHPRNLLDFYQAEVARPAPLVIYIHGGGFAQGSKDSFGRNPALSRLLGQGIHVASISYRYVRGGPDPKPLPGPLHDCARAVQFLRHKAADWKIDPQRVGAFGSSAGGQASLWLAFHNDLADPQSSDPIERESTRLQCVGSINGPCSTDPAWIERHLTGAQVEWFRGIIEKDFGLDSYRDAYRKEFRGRIRECAPITHLSPDDPPVYLQHSAPLQEIRSRNYPGGLIHCPLFGVRLAEELDSMGIEHVLVIQRETHGTGRDPYGSLSSFLAAQLLTARQRR
ncbi:MAG: alpha/beta hydrolase [Planctomycetota bacterium]|nr:alpha/beta hydrolase [Planctomycetota bacterium]